jgi:hypothetical protein
MAATIAARSAGLANEGPARHRLKRPLAAAVALLAIGFVSLGCGGGGGNDVAQSAPSAAGTGNGPPSSRAEAAETAGPAQPEEVRDCLASAGFKATVGASDDVQSGGARGAEVLATRGGAGGSGAVLALYGSSDEASTALPGIQANVEAASGSGVAASVQRYGPTIVAWVSSPATEDRDAILGCLT